MNGIIYPWTLTKRPEEEKLIPEFEKTDLCKSIQANLHENVRLNELIVVDHLRKENDVLQAWMFIYEPGHNGLPVEHIHLIKSANKDETITTIDFRILNEHDHVRIEHNKHGTISFN